MKYSMLIAIVAASFLAGCGNSKGPAKIVVPPVGGGGGGSGGGPVIPGTGGAGKVLLQVENGGSVSTSPNIGSCAGGPGDKFCELRAPRGTVVTLTAHANPGFVFEEWERCPGPSGTRCVLTVDALISVKAEFDAL